MSCLMTRANCACIRIPLALDAVGVYDLVGGVIFGAWLSGRERGSARLPSLTRGLNFEPQRDEANPRRRLHISQPSLRFDIDAAQSLFAL